MASPFQPAPVCVSAQRVLVVHARGKPRLLMRLPGCVHSRQTVAHDGGRGNAGLYDSRFLLRFIAPSSITAFARAESVVARQPVAEGDQQ
jgi:hypothetical protein